MAGGERPFDVAPSFIKTTEGRPFDLAQGGEISECPIFSSLSLSNLIGQSSIPKPGFRLGGSTVLTTKGRNDNSKSGNDKRNDKIIYCLKCDIRKYFDNVDHEILFELLRKKIRDNDILWLLREIIESNPKARPQRLASSSCDGGRGIPIGNLTSQFFANIYLNELDHFVKRELKERYYMRYMDDFLILGADKKHLGQQKERIRAFLTEKLKLELHPKKAEIFPIDKGLDFLGYVLRDNKRFLRKSTVKRFIKRRKRDAKLLARGKISKEFVESSEKSWLGYAKFGDSYQLREKLGLNFENPAAGVKIKI